MAREDGTNPLANKDLLVLGPSRAQQVEFFHRSALHSVTSWSVKYNYYNLPQPFGIRIPSLEARQLQDESCLCARAAPVCKSDIRYPKVSSLRGGRRSQRETSMLISFKSLLIFACVVLWNKLELSESQEPCVCTFPSV
ncbi:hypothetical protein KIL84_002999 [Mauremys mutica]|uniref:Uncharacterized protein n=1 Tax=Mauremys mutica TaxID=74926 RepID=A0A9D3WUZ0_9SAUR|nr:hypothetical protein KIL84_002999 [Mauremys mutica]